MTNITSLFRPEYIRELVANCGRLAPIAFLGIFTLRPVIFFPGSILSLVAGMLFGPIWGTVYTILGTMIGASIAFGISRKLGYGPVRKILGSRAHYLDKFDGPVGSKAVFFIRLFQLAPFDLISYAAGLTKMSFPTFMLSTFVGVIPGALLYCYLGDSMASLKWPAMIITVLLLCAMWIGAALIKRNKSRKNKIEG